MVRQQFMHVAALLSGAALLFMAGALHGLLLPIRGGIEGMNALEIGIMGSFYSIGFVGGCLTVPHIVRRVGHIRSFSVMAAMAASTVLVTLMLIDTGAWIPLRAISGFCFAGTAMIIESWLNERASNENRGTIFSTYMMINLAASTTGQLLVATGDPRGHVLFAVAAILLCLSLVPTALSTSPAPAPLARVRLRIGRLYRTSPVAVVGCTAVGLVNGAFGSLAAVYGHQIGLAVTAIAVMTSSAVLGGAFMQFPSGRLSDHVDRRIVIVGAAICSVIASLALMWTDPRAPSLVIPMVAVLGCFIYPQYALNVAHANDHAAPEDFVETSSGLLLVYGGGAICGPVIAAVNMEIFGPVGLFAHIGVTHGLVALFAIYRMSRRAPVAPDERDTFVQQPATRTLTPQTATFDPRAPDEVEDQDEL